MNSLKIALLLVDNQSGLDHPTYFGTERSNPKYYENLPKLLTGFRELQGQTSPGTVSIIHVYHKSYHEDSPLYSSPGMDFYSFAQPKGDEPVLSKQTHSAFTGTNLEAIIRQHQIQALYIAGVVTDHCVSTTVRSASDLNVARYTTEDGQEHRGRIVLCQDACYCFGKGGIDAETIHRVHVASLDGEFCEVMTTEQVLADIPRGK